MVFRTATTNETSPNIEPVPINPVMDPSVISEVSAPQDHLTSFYMKNKKDLRLILIGVGIYFAYKLLK